MSNELKNLARTAMALVEGADVGKEYTMSYVCQRLEQALDEYPHDPVIRSVATVVNKQLSKGKLVTSQKELYSTYNHFAGINPSSMIKEAIGDLLYPVSNIPQATVGNETAVSYRQNSAPLDMKVEHNPLENLFDKNVNAGTYYDSTLAKLGKQILIEELKNIGVPANEIKVVAGVGDNTAIVYDAVFTNKLGTTHVPMFIEVGNGIQPPTHFYGDNQFIQLTAENLNKYIVDKAKVEEISNVTMSGVKTSSSIISSSFSFEEDGPAPIKFDKVAMPEVLKDFASFDEALLESSTVFTPELVRTAKAVCRRELNNMGFNAQVALAESTDNCIICSAELDSNVGKVEIKLPVEIINDRPQIPSLFYNETNKDKIYDFSQASLSNYLTAAKSDHASIMRYSNDFYNMNYNQLKDEVLSGAANKDYVRAEQALNRIEDKFGSSYHSAALSDYAKYLTLSAADKTEIKVQSKNKCRLLITTGSIEPRCGHYNVSINRVSTNERGDCELLDRRAKYDNLKESNGTLIRSNKITLT